MAEKLNKDAVNKAAKPEEKDYFINDGGGLYLWVKSGGSKLWQFVYTFEGKRKRLALGAYPGVTLEIARRKASIYICIHAKNPKLAISRDPLSKLSHHNALGRPKPESLTSNA